MEDVDLSREGVLHTFTYVAKPAYGTATLDAEGYGVAQVDLPEGVRVQCILLGDPASWRPGQTARLVVEPIGHDDGGLDVVVHRFTNERAS
jgi:uncharacterized OB-fold protein